MLFVVSLLVVCNKALTHHITNFISLASIAFYYRSNVDKNYPMSATTALAVRVGMLSPSSPYALAHQIGSNSSSSNNSGNAPSSSNKTTSSLTSAPLRDTRVSGMSRGMILSVIRCSGVSEIVEWEWRVWESVKEGVKKDALLRKKISKKRKEKYVHSTHAHMGLRLHQNITSVIAATAIAASAPHFRRSLLVFARALNNQLFPLLTF